MTKSYKTVNEKQTRIQIFIHEFRLFNRAFIQQLRYIPCHSSVLKKKDICWFISQSKENQWKINYKVNIFTQSLMFNRVFQPPRIFCYHSVYFFVILFIFSSFLIYHEATLEFLHKYSILTMLHVSIDVVRL